MRYCLLGGMGRVLCVLEELQIPGSWAWGGHAGDEPWGLPGQVGSRDRQLSKGREGAKGCWGQTEPVLSLCPHRGHLFLFPVPQQPGLSLQAGLGHPGAAEPQ